MCSDPEDPTPTCDGGGNPNLPKEPLGHGGGYGYGNGKGNSSKDSDNNKDDSKGLGDIVSTNNEPDTTLPSPSDDPWYIDILAWQYTPLAASAVNVLATDAAFLALALSLTPAAPVTIAIFIFAFGLGRAASIISTASTGYQYQQNLYGTTKNDYHISWATMLVGAIPIPETAVANHVSLIYTGLRTFGAIESP
jgi:hypothetical protein